MPTKIKLSNGGFAIVNNADAALVSAYRWWRLHNHGRSYAQGWVGGKNVLMHRMLMKPRKGFKVDHKNRDGLDNRRRNLRCCTQAQNGMNRVAGSNSTTGLKGVCFHANARSGKKYVARGWDGKTKTRLYLGSFKTPRQAAAAYRAWARKAHGAFFRAS